MDFNVEKELKRLEEKLVKECVWVLDKNLLISKIGSTCYCISINDRPRLDKQFVENVEFHDFEILIQILQHFGIVSDFVKNGLFRLYDGLVENDVKSFVLNIYKYPHSDVAENYEIPH